MLSSAQKFVPTTKQFRQPYFMDIAPDGFILSTCARFAALLKRRNIHNFLGSNLLDIFPRLGKGEPVLTPELFQRGLPTTIDLTIQRPGTNPFPARSFPTPPYAPNLHRTRS